MYANSTGKNHPVANPIVTPKRITTTEGSTLILNCSTSFSTYKIWEKSALTDFKLTSHLKLLNIKKTMIYVVCNTIQLEIVKHNTYFFLVTLVYL
jgi:hypothetical protein